MMTTSWTKRLAVLGAAVLGVLATACGPSPAYEPEPRMPAPYLAPASSEELAAAPQASQPQAAEPAGEEVAIGAETSEYADTDPSALTEWKPVLEGHGRWVDDSTYGTVWVPSEAEVGNDFQPYVSAGHWTYSEPTSWVWVSDYSWGWVPFHYGRWVYLQGYGWSWIPGRQYAGAWVVWRTGAYGYDYVGWAPAPPEYYWYDGWAVGWHFGWYHPHYVYCSHSYIYHPVVRTYVVRGGTPAAAPMEGRTAPYQPASPGVANGGRIPAQPGVGGAGKDRVVATPSVGGHAPGGPRPADLGMKHDLVVPPPGNHAGLERAQAFSSPHTATRLGATPPSTVSPAARPRRVDPDTVAGARAGEAPRSPRVSSHLDPVARAPQVAGVPPVPPRQSSLPESRPVPRPSSPSTAWEGSRAQQAPPSFGSSSPSRAQQAPPSFGSSSPSRGPSFGSSSPSHAAPSFGSAPSSPHVSSSPRVSTPSPSFRSAPSAPSRSTSPSRSSTRRR